MGRLVVDLAGPMLSETWSDGSYPLIVVEASRRYGTGELLVSKDEAYDALVVIVLKLERQSGEKCQMIRSDNGTEFVNRMVEKFCKRNRIAHQTTVLYTPEQNGMAEQALATIFDMVRCMLHFAKLDVRYWGEAFLYAIYIRNMSPTPSLSSLKDQTSYEGIRGSLTSEYLDPLAMRQSQRSFEEGS
jgi:transposase InsO family protein